MSSDVHKNLNIKNLNIHNQHFLSTDNNFNRIIKEGRVDLVYNSEVNQGKAIPPILMPPWILGSFNRQKTAVLKINEL